MSKAAVDSYTIYYIEVTPCNNILLGSSERAASFLLDRTESKERGRMTGVCPFNQRHSSPAKIPSALLHTMEKWV